MDGDQAWPIELELTAPLHVSAFSYWRSRHPSPGLLPSRADIDPTHIPRLLPWINLIDVQRSSQGLRLRHRLIGTAIVEMRQRDNTGRWFDDLYDAATLRRIHSVLAPVINDGTAALYHGDLSAVGRPLRRHDCLVMPLARDGRTVDMVISVPHYS